MNARRLRLALLGLVLLPLIAADSGGWAVVTVSDLPDYVVVGQPVTLDFDVRQHGRTPLNGLHPSIEARAGRLEAKAPATPAKGNGAYTAALTLPRAGEWTITIYSGFGSSAVTLVPIQATERDAAPSRPLPEAERGRRLFAAKGCVTCHVDLRIGPDLTNRRYEPDYLKRFLADPAIGASRTKGTAEMPNLGLKPPEIVALAAFINTERQARR